MSMSKTGNYNMDPSIQHFVENFNAYITPTKFSFKEVKAVAVALGNEQLQTVEHPAVSINMSLTDFEKICHKLYRLYEEEEMRMRDEETYNLWMRYRVYAELKR